MMPAARSTWRWIAAGAGCAALLGGCSAQIAGTGSLAGDARPPVAGTATATPTNSVATPTTPTATPTGTPAATPTGPPTATGTPAASPTPSPSPRPGTIPDAFAGTWTGVASQPGSILPQWNAVLVLPAGGRTGTFAVGTVCRGRVTVASATGTRLVAREVIVSDPTDRCAVAGTITLERTGPNQVRMRWVDAGSPDNTASATLNRR